MIDIHCHILPGLDDGPGTFEESLQMCRKAVSDGIEQIVAAPHVKRNGYDNTKSNIITQTTALKALLRSEGLPLELIPAAAVHFEWDLLERIKANEVLMLGSKVQYLLLEPSLELIPPHFDKFIYELLLRGIVPIITHPERNYEIQQNLTRLYNLVDLGLLVQVASMSLTGEFGWTVEKTVKNILKHRLAHLIGTEAHSKLNRPPILSSALKVASKTLSNEEAMAMVTETPARILRGEYVEPAEPLSPPKKWSFRWFGFARK